ncbi:MAG TPA: hypothetical protein IAD32_05380 [Candidatus Scatavimonas merdigallinarum]|uniref:Uncharacterized protein n=1 Tax=Candidatus Scatavimonas merdigallinarum TaxID=2840914 RepID=A0A9D0ZIB1_9FIRM|nr:hypothetical protein [Candidatus Scatavimonas merdigallinarum]
MKAREKLQTKKRLSQEIKENKGTFLFYIVIRVIVIGVMIMGIFSRNYESVFVCALTLVLFLIPSFVEKRLRIDLPNTLEVIVILFIFAAEILGEINAFYIIIPAWDTMLHTINGFLMAAIGFSLVDIFNRSDRIKFSLSPAFLAVVAFCFSMTIGVLWEFFEFGADLFLHTDMQKDTFIQHISSVALHPEGKNIAVHLDAIGKTVVHTAGGETYTFGAYLDIGLIDTMKDLFVNFLGAIVFSVIGFFYIKGRGKTKFAGRFIPKIKEENKQEKQ